MRAPFSGCSFSNLFRKAMRPGISFSASSISLRPQDASEMSLTLYAGLVVVDTHSLLMSAMSTELVSSEKCS